VRTPADTATTYASQSFMALLLRYSTGALLSTSSRGPRRRNKVASLPSAPREAANPVPVFGGT
jgi:hypothetical protein